MSDDEKNPKGTPQFFVRPEEGATPEGLAEQIADGLIARINEVRASKGLPPLIKGEKDAP